MSNSPNQPGSYRYSKEQRMVSSSRGNMQSDRMILDRRMGDKIDDQFLSKQLVYRTIEYGTEIGFDELVKKRQVLTDLLTQLGRDEGRIVFDDSKKDDYRKRLLLLENQIEGLMRQTFVYDKADEKGHRVLDYSALINSKENQVVELEKKITVLEGKQRMSDFRMRELEAQIQKLHGIILSKNKIIEQLQNSSKRSFTDSATSSKASNQIKHLMGKLQNLEQKSCTMQQLEGAIESWILSLQEDSLLKSKLLTAELRYTTDEKYRSSIMRKLGQISQLYKTQIDSLKSSSKTKIQYDERIINPLGSSSIKVGSSGNQNRDGGFLALLSGGADIKSIGSHQTGLDILSEYFDLDLNRRYVRTVEVPVQDSQTKMLIYKLVKQMNRLVTKYPKLNKEISGDLAQFCTQQILDCIQVDEFDKLVSIVKYEPSIVKVDNVYTYSSQKSRKVEFHLRVLIKALLEEIQKAKKRTGVELQIDSGVIGMIRQQITDVVEVDDILRVFRVVPKIVEVEKVVEKVIQRIVEVPKVVAVQTSSTIPIQSKRYEVVQNIRNVPVEIHLPVPVIEQKIVRIPEYVERIVEVSKIEPQNIETVREVPKLRTIETVVPRDREVERIIEMEGPERIVQVPQVQIQQIVLEKIVQIMRTEEIIKEVDRIIEKPIEIIKQVPKMVVVEKIIEKIIPVKEYINNDVNKPYIVDRPYPVEVIVEKIIPVERIVERIVEVPQIIEKIIVVEQIREIIKQVEVIKEVPIYKKQIQIVERYIERPTEVVVEVEKVFDRHVEVPIVHDNVRIETEYIKEPVFERVQRIIHQEVPVEVPVIMYEDKVVEVQIVKNVVLVEQEPIEITRDKIVPIQTVRDQIIPTPTIIEKIIQKLVEVPKIVEIERIVEKIIPVPRIVEKIVEVEKIVQKIVEKVILQQVLIEVERRVQVPVIKEVMVEIQVPRTVYTRVQVPREVIKQVMVVDQEIIQRPTVQYVQQPPRIVVQRREIEVPMVVEKIVSVRTYDNKYVQLKEQVIVPIEIQVPKHIIQEKLVPVEHIKPIVEEVDRVIEKIIQVTVENTPEVITVDRLVEKLQVQYDKEFIEVSVPQPFERIVEVERFVEKIIPPVTVEIERIKEVPYMVEKIVDRMVQIPRIYEVEKRVDVPIERPYVYQIQKLVPQIITLNQSIEKIVERVIEVPTLLEKINNIDRVSERVVPIKDTKTNVEIVDRTIEKQVLIEKLKQVHSVVNHVSEVMKVVEKMVEKPVDPVIIYNQKIMEVPVVVEKIAEKIIIMPQIVQILKYVHEITEQDNLGVAVSGEIGIEEVEYQRLGKNLNIQLSKLKAMLSSSLRQGGDMRSQITIIDTFLAEFNKFIMYPRIREIMTQKMVEKTVEKDRIVKIPVSSIEDEKRNLASAVLIDKLIIQLRRLKKANPNLKFDLDSDIEMIFGGLLNPISGEYGNNYNKLLDQYNMAIFSRFSSAGSWSPDHHEMLREFINDRFQLAYLSKKNQNQAKQYRARYESAVNSSRKYKEHIEDIQKRFIPFNEIIPAIIEEGLLQQRLDRTTKTYYEDLMHQITQAVFGYAMAVQPKSLDKIQYARINSVIRAKEEEIILLKERIQELMRSKTETRQVIHVRDDADHTECNRKTRQLQEEIWRLRRVEEDYTKCKGKLEIFIRIEQEHRGCKKRIDELLAVIERLKRNREDKEVSPIEKSKPKSPGQNYGTHYEEYTNLQEHQMESSEDQFASRHNVKGYGSAGGNTTSLGYNSGYQQYMTSSRGSSGDIGVESRGYTYKSAVHRVEHSGGEQSSHKTIEYSRSGSNMDDSLRGIGTGMQGSDIGSSRMYEQSNREIIRRTYRQQDMGGNSTGSSRKFQRDNLR